MFAYINTNYRGDRVDLPTKCLVLKELPKDNLGEHRIVAEVDSDFVSGISWDTLQGYLSLTYNGTPLYILAHAVSDYYLEVPLDKKFCYINYDRITFILDELAIVVEELKEEIRNGVK